MDQTEIFRTRIYFKESVTCCYFALTYLYFFHLIIAGSKYFPLSARFTPKYPVILITSIYIDKKKYCKISAYQTSRELICIIFGGYDLFKSKNAQRYRCWESKKCPLFGYQLRMFYCILLQ